MEELKKLLTAQGAAFEDFKKANDDRIKAIEAKGYAPAEVEAKVGKINDDLSELGKQIADIAKKSNRPAPAAGEISAEEAEYKTAFREAFLRKGNDEGLKELERKAFQSGSDVDGGYLIDSEMEASIDRIAGTVSAMRGLADVRTYNAGVEQVTGNVAKAIGDTGADGPQAMGKVIAALKPQLAGRADMGAVSGMVKAALSK